MSMTSLLAFTPWPPLSALILLVLLVTALYLARGTAHQAIHALAMALSRGLRARLTRGRTRGDATRRSQSRCVARRGKRGEGAHRRARVRSRRRHRPQGPRQLS